VIISGDGMPKELFYVAASRGRQSVTVITSDKERLQETVARSMARASASELMRVRGHTRIEVWQRRETWFVERPGCSRLFRTNRPAGSHSTSKGADP